MKKKRWKRLLSCLMIVVMLVTLAPTTPAQKVEAVSVGAGAGAQAAEDAAFAELEAGTQVSEEAAKKVLMDDLSVYIRQVPSDCNVTSHAMLLRRLAIWYDYSGWKNITPDTIRSIVTGSNYSKSPKFYYTYGPFSITCYSKDNSFIYMNAEQKKQHLISELAKHPEGIVIWGPNVCGPQWPHAILLTDYTNGQFYCMDPASNAQQGRVPFNNNPNYKGNIDLATQYYILTAKSGVQLPSNTNVIVPNNAPSTSTNPDAHQIPTRALSYGSSGDDVAWVQAILNNVNGTNLSIDGKYGSGTRSAVMTFQRQYGLSADGVVGPATRAKMQEAWNAKKVVAASSITVSPTSLTLTAGKKSGQIAANIGPSNTTNKTITWSTSNKNVATVNNGVVTAISAGSAKITASTHNGKTATCTVTVYDPCTITFVNEDGTVLDTQKVDYGKSATAPKNPEKTGYTFAGWDGTYQNVKEDATVTATYTKNTYKVTFKETDGTKIGSTQNVPYNEAAVAPDESSLNIPEGYTFTGWSENFEHVTSDLDIYPVYKWADEELPLTISAEDNACVANYEEGTYSLSFDLINHSEAERRARVMTYMITESGKMVAQGETRTVKIPAATVAEDGTVTDGVLAVDDMYIVCSNAADKARIVVLDDYESAVPLAEIKDVAVEAAGYGEWTEEEPTDAESDYMTRTVYRSKAVSYKESTSTNSIAGWTLYNTTKKNSGNGDAVKYGSGRSATPPSKSGVYRTWASAIAYQYNPSAHTVPTYNISISTTGGATYQSMVRWIQTCLCRYGYSTSIDGVFGYNTAAAVKSFQSANGLSADGIVGAGTRTCMQNKLNSDPLYNYYYESLKVTNTYYFYQEDANWSDWKTEAIAGDTTLNAGTTKTLVESKTQYRYKEYATETIGTMMKPECKLPEQAMSLAGKDAVVIVFKNKVNQIAEDNVQYIGNTTIGTDGSLDISFVPREEQTYDGTGDYTVVLGVKGTTNYVKVATIEAPKPTYTVTFVDEDGTKLSEQEVAEGHDAEVPESPTKEGHTFIGWDTGVTNIHANLTITAQYKKNNYNVTYVDWENRTFESESYEYGDIITLPEAPTAPEGMEFVSWGIEENTEITEDIICEAEFKKQVFTVTFVDWDGNVVIEEKIEYGDSAMSPEVVEGDVEKDETVPEKIGDMEFISWGEDIDLNNITTNLVVGAIYEYSETVVAPVASVKSGEYGTVQTVELTTETEDAIIYYTIDGSDPTDVENKDAVKMYSGAITITDKTKLKFYATKMGMNDSPVNEEWYCINQTGNVPTHLVNIYAINTYDLTVVSDYRDFVEDGSMLDVETLLTDNYESVELEGFYYDVDFTDKWQEGSQTITESLELYAKYVAKKFKVTYQDEDGTLITTGEVEYGMSVDNSVAPEKVGYRFAGWKSEGNKDVVTEDITVTATYISESEYAVINFTRSNYSVMEGTTFKLNPKVTFASTGENATEENIIWTSSDENFATVDDQGNVTALAKGEVTVLARVADSNETAVCTIKITGNPETSICLYSNASYRLEDGYLREIEIGKNSVAEIKKQINADNLKFYDDSNIELNDTEFVGTGTRIQMLDEKGAMLDEVVVIIVGDYNGDGVINGKDVSGLTRCLLGKETATDVRLRAMDLNGDGYVNNRDAAMLGRYLVGKEDL